MAWWNWIGRIVELPFALPQQRLMQSRGDYDKDAFLRSFDVDPEISGAVWDALSREAVVERFKPMSADNLQRVFGLADEDLDDLVLEVLVRCGCRVPPACETEGMSAVRTVSDLIEFVAAMRDV